MSNPLWSANNATAPTRSGQSSADSPNVTVNGHAEDMSAGAGGATDASDAAARACAWAARLADDGRVGHARDVLLKAMDDLGAPVTVALRLAQLETSAGEQARAGQLLHDVLRAHPGEPGVVLALARLLLSQGKPGEAAAVISDVGDDGHEFRELVGEICRAQGRHADAVVAFGDPRTLSVHGRRLRRRSWWLSTGRRVRPAKAVTAKPGTGKETGASATQPPPDELLESVSWAAQLSTEKRHDEARAALADAIGVHGRHPLLLRAAAQAEDEAGGRNAALYLWREAHRIAPGDALIAAGLAESSVDSGPRRAVPTPKPPPAMPNTDQDRPGTLSLRR